MSPSQNDKQNERLAEKLRRMADKRGGESPFAEEAARLTTPQSPQGQKRATRVTEKPETQQESE